MLYQANVFVLVCLLYFVTMIIILLLLLILSLLTACKQYNVINFLLIQFGMCIHAWDIYEFPNWEGYVYYIYKMGALFLELDFVLHVWNPNLSLSCMLAPGIIPVVTVTNHYIMTVANSRIMNVAEQFDINCLCA